MTRWLARAVTLSALLTTQQIWAANCGVDDCGAHGSCRMSSLLPRCDCEEGYFSVSTFLEPSSLGAYCVPVAAAPSERACAGIECGPHGVCTVLRNDAGSVAAQCICDPGFRVGSQAVCEDDPADDSEAVCLAVDCGTNTCMATSDAVTCRCNGGGQVVLGAGADGGFGPVCSVPPDPATACGPDACGPHGSCVISQAIFCDCDEGSTQKDFTGPDGKPHPYCARPGETFPQQAGGGGSDAAVADAGPEVRDAGLAVPGPVVSGDRGGCQLAHGAGHDACAVSWGLAALCAVWVRRRAMAGGVTKADHAANRPTKIC
jgi:hypothetical protein